jgi:DNA-binding NtrC family response regulator
MATILCVDADPLTGETVGRTLARAGHTAISAGAVPAALEALRRGGVDLILSDERVAGRSGLDLLALLKREGFDLPVIVTTGDGSIEHAVAAMKAGALDYVAKPMASEQVELAVGRALDVVRRRDSNGASHHAVDPLRGEDGPRVLLRSLNVQEAERVLIRHALDAAGQNRTRAAELLGISVRTLRNKLNRPAARV